MPDQSTAGYRIGTFEGRCGDQRGLGESRNEHVLRPLPPDPDTGEPRAELVTRAHKPVDTPTMRTELPAHAIERYVEVLESILEG